jgi:hypothetical protein
MKPTESSDPSPASNPDPLTGEPGSHPVATAAGAAAGGTAGAAIGALAGPMGTAIGGVVGAIAGGLSGSAVGEVLDPTVEDAHWRESHDAQPYAKGGHPYEKYIPGYRAGYQGFHQHGASKPTFEEAEADLRSEYDAGAPDLTWEHAREAARAAWERRQRLAVRQESAPAHLLS